MNELAKLPQDEIADLCARHFLEIEYLSDAPPPVDLRQQIEQALPANRYRLLRIARRFQKNEDTNLQHSKIDLEPPTPEKLFTSLSEKMGYQPDQEATRDFLQLLAEAQHELDQNKA